jgi:hypothetical protein
VARGFFPLDERLALGAEPWSPFVHASVVRLGTWLPFEQVPEGLAHFTRVAVDSDTARRLTEAAGAALVQVETAAVERLEGAPPPPAPAGPAVLQLSVDGAMVPLVGGEWAEVKTLATATLAPPTREAAGPRATALSYFSRLADWETFQRLAWVETERRGVLRAGRVCGVQDGAEWQPKFVRWHRPDAVLILDFPHAVEHLSTAAHAAFGAASPVAQAWIAAWAHELKHGDPAAVLAAPAALPVTSAADPTQAATAQAATLEYLRKREDRIQYARFQAAGYPIGSGIVESANKLVVEARLKGAGMHWARHNVNALVALRAVACSDRWTAVWPQIWQHLRHVRTQRQRQQRAARRPPPVAPPGPAPPPCPARAARTAVARLPLGRVRDGRPTAEHPWRKSGLRRACPPTTAKS